MAKLFDSAISPLPIRISDLKVERSKLKIQSLTILQFGHLPGRTLKRKFAKYEHWSLSYIVRGKGIYHYDDEPVQRLEAGSIYWEWPGSVFHYGPTEHGGWDEYYVSFAGNRVQEWLNSGIILPDRAQFIGVDPYWIQKLEAIGDYLDSGVPDNADRAALLFESLVFDMYAARLSKTADRAGRVPEQTVRVLEYIASHLYQPWDERQVWEQNHISRSTLRRIVRQNTGYSLNEYVNRLKIAEAKKLLLHTSLQVKEIAHMLGYADPAYFSRLFHRYAGVSAAAFRSQSMRQDVQDGQQGQSR